MNRILLVVSVLFLTFASTAHAKDPFEGTTWHITATPDDDARGNGSKPVDDTIKFKGGKFISESFKAKGFDEVDYDTDTRQGGIATFTVNAKSDKNGSIRWSGTIAATEINGDLVWTKADGSVCNFAIKGEKKT